ncbi:Pentatricopeptide repeat-containing protein [Heracleum sosnowskyi]|uniref:Pentatricopeptide repeat-containing protein n=1 Tax=Heracleum sosnowskyi TaxID=360622 RepID=A0AAD8JBI2_9APIA|nr:Pentatricopeptide repeat-containing protein [Heracleum sosnowskyi]
MIKTEECEFLNLFSKNFCPYLLVKILRLLGDRETAFSFFKFSFCDDSDENVFSCCLACHVLAREGSRYLAQDMITWIILKIGESRCRELVEWMWRGHWEYESDFSVLDSLMRGFLNVGMAEQAVVIVGKMREVGLVPSLSAVSSLFRLLFRVGGYCSVWKLFRDMIRKGPRPSNYVFNTMILGFCRKGFLSTGESLLHVMIKFGCEPDAVSYNIVINAYCTRCRIPEAWNWVDLMVKRQCLPSMVTFSTLINALCKEGNIVDARNLFDGMLEIGLVPNTTIYNVLMDGYVKAREIRQANVLFLDMRNKGVAPDGVTFNTLVGGHYKYGKKEDADRLFMEFSESGVVPDHSFTDVLVAGLCWAGRLHEATDFLKSMLEKGLPLSVIAFNSIITAYGKAGLEDKAFEVYG